MRIGELAARTGVRVRRIRFYEQAGLLPAPERTPAGQREYDDGAVTRLRFARSAQALGLSLAQIAEIPRLRDPRPDRGLRGARPATSSRTEAVEA
ncbi:MerR family transcriptional regulator [Pseudonocardia sp. RS010]|uniref:MerR family transcriptional regulator n=1 Tax=Pseudonocardia sp. RS010 TaxID=3385979 RepID=UPI0039A1977D